MIARYNLLDLDGNIVEENKMGSYLANKLDVQIGHIRGACSRGTIIRRKYKVTHYEPEMHELSDYEWAKGTIIRYGNTIVKNNAEEIVEELKNEGIECEIEIVDMNDTYANSVISPAQRKLKKKNISYLIKRKETK